MKTIAVPTFTVNQERNFWAKVEPTGFCWNWTAMKSIDGYGKFSVNRRGKQVLAHRAAYTHLVGVIPEGMELDHICRNRACVNPDHLEPVTRSQNLLRIPEPLRRGKGTLAPPPWVKSGKNVTGSCIRGHEYTEDNTYTYKDGRTECRICKAWNRAKYRRRMQENIECEAA